MPGSRDPDLCRRLLPLLPVAVARVFDSSDRASRIRVGGRGGCILNPVGWVGGGALLTWVKEPWCCAE